MVLRKESGSAAYSYAAEPKSVQSKSKFRQDEPQYPANIMFDRRVVRGNTYAAQILPAIPTAPQPAAPVRPRRRKAATRKISTPPAVPGRQHMDIQTENYLEEVTDMAPEEDAVTQTDAFLERPVTPMFVPQKRGVDTETQIEEGELFDFDFEVEPLLEVLVGKTLEQSLMEVLEEEELAAMRAHQEHFERIRNAELVALQKIEQAERRKVEEKERRLQQERARLQREKVVREKVAAATFARGFLSGMVDSVVAALWTQGYFYDPVEKGVKEDFMPWLRGAVDGELARRRRAREAVAALVSGVLGRVEAAREARRAGRAAEQEALQRVRAARAARAEAATAAAAAAAEARATYILHELKPAFAAPGRIEAARAELESKADEAATARWEEAKTAAADAAREAAEADKAAAEERRAAAAEAAAERGDEGDGAAAASEEEIDVDKAAADAAEAVEKPDVAPLTDADVLNAMLEADPGLKAAIVTSMATEALGAGAWIHDERFEGELTPAEAEA